MGLVETLRQGILGSLLAGVLFIGGGFGLLRGLLPVLAKASEVIPNSGVVIFLFVLLVYGSVVRLTLGLGTKASLVGCITIGSISLGTLYFVVTTNIFAIGRPDYQFLAIAIGVGMVVFITGYVVGERFRTRLANKFNRPLLLTTYFTSIEPTTITAPENEIVEDNDDENSPDSTEADELTESTEKESS